MLKSSSIPVPALGFDSVSITVLECSSILINMPGSSSMPITVFGCGSISITVLECGSIPVSAVRLATLLTCVWLWQPAKLPTATCPFMQQ